MKLTIITIVYNGVNEIEKTIQSIISNNSIEKIEYILIDGGSIDGTMDIVEKYKGYFSKIVSEKDNGIADAFNKGISYATGDLIGLMNARDCLLPNTYDDLERQFNKNVDVYYGEVEFQSKFHIVKVNSTNHSFFSIF